MNIFLDSSAIIDFLRGRDGVKAQIDAADDVYTSSLCVFEVLLGEAYSRLKGFNPKSHALSFFEGTTIVPFSVDDAKRASEMQALLVSKGKRINGLDVLIAASAIRVDSVIITSDQDYEILSDLLSVNVKII